MTSAGSVPMSHTVEELCPTADPASQPTENKRDLRNYI